jgi:hypothetical protein
VEEVNLKWLYSVQIQLFYILEEAKLKRVKGLVVAKCSERGRDELRGVSGQ